MSNLFDSAKTIQEKRDLLKGLSKPLQQLVKEEALNSVNEGLKAIYQESGHAELKTLHEWNREGKRIKKGEHALCLWGRPRQKEDSGNEPNSTGESVSDETDPLNFFPICYVFSNLQVHEKEA